MASLRSLLLRPHTTANRISSRITTTSTATRHLTTSPFAPRHLLSIADLTIPELTTLVLNAKSHKSSIKSSNTIPTHLQNALSTKTIPLLFTKRSTRTRVSSEAAITLLGGHPLFLAPSDIQLGVNESLYDTSVVISSMTSAIIARVNGHREIVELAKNSSVPVINALSDLYHPMQTIADLQTLVEAFPDRWQEGRLLEGLKIAWVGDANNVLFDLAIGAAKIGMRISVATPQGYEIPDHIRNIINAINPTTLSESNVPEEAVKNADVLVTDTWVSMGQEEESLKRMAAFQGFQITEAMARRGGAKEGWKFMHCLPRHQEEVDDEVFYGNGRSLVFEEAENRLWAALSVLEGRRMKKEEEEEEKKKKEEEKKKKKEKKKEKNKEEKKKKKNKEKKKNHKGESSAYEVSSTKAPL